ncbi:hypothetical protein BV509_18450 [Rhodovulum sulfidophilum]|uniref:Calcium-binding protein n=1 Tax=Rhodovulum visakhapatnamense TaxID=364297 RepID=A0ABS1RJ20_9RHOB|nr:calcium-binding protein [Rhodovulum visakhapatnamense]MBL3570278.1 calcium-binding protein [Rhodovulum visakhapatnamense]MBL3579654.1 calcium-binding protein [Rhodovulum visakhapatnamense]OLS46136.1 hypothetical protein BV509_18450 [Rhodovulum sulfidophilum]
MFTTGDDTATIVPSGSDQSFDALGGIDTVTIDASALSFGLSGSFTAGGWSATYNSVHLDIDNVERMMVIGGSGDDFLSGGDDNDTLLGGAGNDYLWGGDGADLIDGGAGNDEVWAGTGDVVTGGAGTDTLILNLGVSGAQSIDLTTGAGTGVTWSGFERVDLYLSGVDRDVHAGFALGEMDGQGMVHVDYSGTDMTGRGAASINFSDGEISVALDDGSVADTTIYGFRKVEVIGSSGNDSIFLGDVDGGTVDGGAGNDRIWGGYEHSVLYGGDGDDEITGYSDYDIMHGGAGNDSIYGYLYSDSELWGDDGDDYLDSGDSDGELHGGAGNDTLIGGEGSPLLDGGDGDDYILTMLGQDDIDGGAGYDYLRINAPYYGIDYDLDISQNGGIRGIEFAKITLADGDDTIRIGIASAQIARTGGADHLILDYSEADETGRTATAVSFDLAADLSTATLSDGSSISCDLKQDLFTVIGTGGSDLIDASIAALSCTLSGNAGADTIFGGDGNDDISGGGANDTLSGSAGNDLIDGGSGNDLIYGGSGNDTLTGGAWDDVLNGEAGDDTFLYAAGSNGYDMIDGGSGTADRILALADNVTIGLSGLTGVEIVDAGGHTGVRLLGSAAGNLIDLSASTLIGIGTIDGGSGSDTILGTAGADTIIGGKGADSLEGGAGDDIFQVAAGAGTDIFRGGSGQDTILAIANSVAMTVTGETLTDIETISSGGHTGFTLVGLNGADVMDFSSVALSGVARIDGKGGNDTITGSAGADLIEGGAGADILTGMAGADVFDFNNASHSRGSSVDVIADFQSGEDLIDLSGVDADSGLAGDQSFALIGAAAFSGTAGELRVDTVSLPGTTVILGDISGNGQVDLEIRLDGLHLLTEADFLL